MDHTELKGDYSVTMDVPSGGGRGGGRGAPGRGGAPAGDVGNPVEQASEPEGLSIFNSLQKLGLRLERRKGPVEHLVVEHVERVPTEN
jgi:uncharacterized protein (TIGR03435 family)